MRLVAALCACLLLGGCHTRSAPDIGAGFPAQAVRLEGMYGVAVGPLIEPQLRVSRTATGYTFDERVHGEWSTDPETPRTATAADVATALGPVTFPVFGLATARAVLLKVPANWSRAHEVSKTGYVLVEAGQTHAAEKMELGKR